MGIRLSMLRKVILSFLKVGIIGFGGGSALIPIIEKEVVSGKGLVDEKTYTEHTVIANITPGALPVKLGAASGEVIAGNIGMFAGAFAVTLPGTLLTALLLSAMSVLSPGVLHYIEYASIGVTVFIITLLWHYISHVMLSSAKRDFGRQAVIIMLITVICTFGKEIRASGVYIFGSLPDMLKNPVLDVSTIDLLIVAFFIIAGTAGIFNNLKGIAVAALSGLYLLLAGDMSPIDAGLMKFIRLFTIVLIFIFVIIDMHNERSTGVRINWMRPVRQSILFISFILIMSGLSFIIVGDVNSYVGNGIVSSATSFGGGEAYLTVADGIFVGSNYVTSGDFYGKILPIANALPGPILVKILSGVGYLKGFQLAGLAGGYTLGVLGMSIGVGASVVIFAFVHEIYKGFSKIKLFQLLNMWILPVVCGLLISTIIAMVNESLKILHEAGIGNLFAGAMFLACFLVVFAAQKWFRIHDMIIIVIVAVMASGVISMVAKV